MYFDTLVSTNAKCPNVWKLSSCHAPLAPTGCIRYNDDELPLHPQFPFPVKELRLQRKLITSLYRKQPVGAKPRAKRAAIRPRTPPYL